MPFPSHPRQVEGTACHSASLCSVANRYSRRARAGENALLSLLNTKALELQYLRQRPCTANDDQIMSSTRLYQTTSRQISNRGGCYEASYTGMAKRDRPDGSGRDDIDRPEYTVGRPGR